MNRNILAYSLFVLIIGLIAVGCGGGGGGGSANPVAAPVSTGSVANLSGVVSLENVPLANAKVFLYPSPAPIWPESLSSVLFAPVFLNRPLIMTAVIQPILTPSENILSPIFPSETTL